MGKDKVTVAARRMQPAPNASAPLGFDGVHKPGMSRRDIVTTLVGVAAAGAALPALSACMTAGERQGVKSGTNVGVEDNNSSAHRVRGRDGSVNVKWFGAKGDGSSNDTTAILAAVSALTAGTLFFPSGTYLVNDTILIQDKPIVLAGEGMSASILRWTGPTSKDAIVMAQSAPGQYGIMGAGVRDLRLRGDGRSHAGAGIRVGSGLMISLERVWIDGFWGPGGTGLRVDELNGSGVTVGPSQLVYLSHVHLQANDIGLYVDGLNQATAINLMSNQNRTGGAHLTNVNVFKWCGGLVQGGAPHAPMSYGVKLQAAPGKGVVAFDIDGVYFEMYVTGALIMSRRTGNGISNIGVRNCRFSRVPGPDPHIFFDFESVTDLLITNNRLLCGPPDTALKAYGVIGGVVGSTSVDTSTNASPLVNIRESKIAWIGGQGFAGEGADIAAVQSPSPGAQTRVVGAVPSGSTASRPPSPVVGQQYFDTSVGLPTWYNGRAWINASGVTVR